MYSVEKTNQYYGGENLIDITQIEKSQLVITSESILDLSKLNNDMVVPVHIYRNKIVIRGLVKGHIKPEFANINEFVDLVTLNMEKRIKRYKPEYISTFQLFVMMHRSINIALTQV